MKFVAFRSALFGVAAGLLFGLLLWGGATAPAVPVVGGASEVETEMLATLRDLRTLLERQASGVRPGVLADATASVSAAPQPLTPSATEHSVEELRAALGEAITALHRVAGDGAGGFAGQAVSPDAAETLKAALGADSKRPPFNVFGFTPREVHALLGRPSWARAEDGGVVRMWQSDGAQPNGTLGVRFADGYAYSWWAQ